MTAAAGAAPGAKGNPLRFSLRLKIVGGFALVAVAALALTGVALVELSQTTRPRTRRPATA
jgi:hypothetical protein